jgi:hypothetical protein
MTLRVDMQGDTVISKEPMPIWVWLTMAVLLGGLAFYVAATFMVEGMIH